MSDFVIIVAGGIDETQRTLIHAQIKAHSDEWWHEIPDVWVVGTQEDVVTWRERLAVFMPLHPSMFFVFKLPEEGARPWSGSGVKERWEWLMHAYAGPSGSKPLPKPVPNAEPPF